MDKSELTHHFACGIIEKEYENARAFSVVIQLVFTIVGGYFFWAMLSETAFISRLDNIFVILFCLWRIHRQRDVMCYATEKGLIVRRQFMSLQEFIDEQFHNERSLVFVPYHEILVVSNDWRQLQIGAIEEGGIAVLPIHLQYVSKKNKQAIMDRIKAEQENN